MANQAARIEDSNAPTYSPTTTEITGRSPDQRRSVTWNPQDGTVKISVRSEAAVGGNVGPTQMRLLHAREAAVTLGDNRDARAGTTQFSVESQFVATARGEIAGTGRFAGAGAEAEAQAGARSRYRVTLPDTRPGEPATRMQAAGVNPFDPTTLPVGGRVALDAQTFTQTELQLGFRNIATLNRVTDARGVGISITRLDENQVRVVTGPNRAVEGLQAIGIDTGVVRAMVGRQDLIGQSTMQTADFDLRQPDAQAAYMHFMMTGRVAHETPGVTNTARVDRLDFTSQQRAQLGLLDDRFNVDVAGRRNTGTQIRTTYPDGQYTLTQQLQYDQNVPLTVTRQYDRNGSERVAERTYEFQVDTRTIGDPTTRQGITDALNATLPSGGAPITSGQQITATFTEAQMQELMARANAAVDRSGVRGDSLSMIAREGSGGLGQPRQDGFDFAVAMARSIDSTAYGFAGHMLRIAEDSPGGTIRPINAQVAAEPPSQAQTAAPSAPGQSGATTPNPSSPEGAPRSGDPSPTTTPLAQTAPASQAVTNDPPPQAPVPTPSVPRSGVPDTSNAQPVDEPQAGRTSSAAIPAQPAPANQTSAVPNEPDPRDPRHRDHALYNQCVGAVHRLDASLGRQSDGISERMAMAATVAARQNGLDRVDHLVVGDRGQAFVVQGSLDSPAHLRGNFDSRTAISTPVDESVRQLQALPTPQQGQPDNNPHRQQDDNRRQEMPSPVLSR